MLFTFLCSWRKFAEVNPFHWRKTKISSFQIRPANLEALLLFSRQGSAGQATRQGFSNDWTAPFVKEKDPPTPDRRGESSSKTRQLEHPRHHTPNFFLQSFPHTAGLHRGHLQLNLHSLAVGTVLINCCCFAHNLHHHHLAGSASVGHTTTLWRWTRFRKHPP